ncbi:MAG: cell wall hydrolase [Robiginitomaculum sp.]|nr:MAG: cell wall hydrolase [Robiginitomaculum sp.]
MTKKIHIYLGWGLAIAVMAGTLVGLPKMADASLDIKDHARWQARAGNLQNVGAEFHSTSNLAKTMAERNLDASISNPYMLDYQLTADLSQNGLSYIPPAKAMARETNCLAEAVYYEARSETTDGQKAVAEVVLNRAAHRAFPNSVCGVVYQGAERTTGCQFSFTCDGSTAKLPYGRHWEKSQTIAVHMMIGANAPLTNRATHYHTTDVNPKWAPSLRKLRKYETHVFYRFMPRKKRLRPVSVAP